MSSTPTILCPVDLSGHSRLVVQHAGAVAEHFGARLLIVTVSADGSRLTPQLEALVRLAVAPHGAARVTVETVRDPGPPASPILRLARDEGADLIVMGTHGTGGVRKLAFGSTAESVLRDTDVPTLMVPRRAEELPTVRHLRELGRVLAPTDFSELSRRDVHVAAAIAQAIGVPLLLMHVVPAVRGFLDSDQRWQSRTLYARSMLDVLRQELNSRPVEILVQAGSPSDEIAKAAVERHAGLIVMGLCGAGGAYGRRPGSIAYRVLCHTSTLLLAIPPVLSGGARRHRQHTGAVAVT